MIDKIPAAACLLGLGLLLASCTTSSVEKVQTERKAPQVVQPVANYLTPLPDGSPSNPLNIQGKTAVGYQNPYPKGTHAYFAAQPNYPKTLDVWSEDALLLQLSKNNSKLIICLPQQRARVYVNGMVAMDWPISTGTDGHLTPTGVFRVYEKKEKHSSSRYGSYVDVSTGQTTSSNADRVNDNEEGLEFRGASMPFWHRFTWDGVGLHSGKVVAGKRLSHGCVRTPYAVAKKFYSYSQVDMPVFISRGIEDYARGGRVEPIDVKYRPLPNNDYTDNYIPKPKAAAAPEAAPAPEAGGVTQ